MSRTIYRLIGVKIGNDNPLTQLQENPEKRKRKKVIQETNKRKKKVKPNPMGVLAIPYPFIRTPIG